MLFWVVWHFHCLPLGEKKHAAFRRKSSQCRNAIDYKQFTRSQFLFGEMWTPPWHIYGSSDKDYDLLFPFHSWTSQPDSLACPHHPWLKPLIHLFGTILHVHFWAQNVRRTETCSNEMGAFERGGGWGWCGWCLFGGEVPAVLPLKWRQHGEILHPFLELMDDLTKTSKFHIKQTAPPHMLLLLQLASTYHSWGQLMQ